MLKTFTRHIQRASVTRTSLKMYTSILSWRSFTRHDTILQAEAFYKRVEIREKKDKV